MDDLDRSLLSLLRANAREAAASLAKKLKISRGTVQNRIAAMEKRGVIQGFTVRTQSGLEPRASAPSCASPSKANARPR